MKSWYESKIVRLCALGILGAVADGLVNGLGWRAIAAAALLAVVAVVRVYWTTETIGTPGAPPPSLILPALLALGLGAGGCAMSPAQRLQLVAEGTYQLHQVAAPAWSSACEAKAKACIAEGITASKDCEPWDKCQTGLKRFYEAHMAIQRGIQQAAWYLLNDKAELASQVLATAQAGLAAAFELARAEGAIQ